MPVFEYKCEACGAEFEQLLAAARHAKSVKCAKCGSKKVIRQISAFSAQSASAKPPPTRGCGRCGDPNGPCSIG